MQIFVYVYEIEARKHPTVVIHLYIYTKFVNLFIDLFAFQSYTYSLSYNIHCKLCMYCPWK
jgi:hypothetical protein